MSYYRGAWIKRDMGLYWWNNRSYDTLSAAQRAVDEAWLYLQKSIVK